MISLKKLKILTPLQKLPKNVGDLGKLIVAKGFEKNVQSPINRPIWSHRKPTETCASCMYHDVPVAAANRR